MQNLRKEIGTQNGYILLLSVLIIGSICATILASLLMLGVNSSKVSISVRQSEEALSLAEGCAEYGLLQLRNSLDYQGNEVLSYSNGICEILTIGGTENDRRTLCTDGQVGDITRRLEIVVENVVPQTKIASWQEVATFSLCP